MTNVKSVKASARKAMSGVFPYEDCRHLAALRNDSPSDLITSLDWYFSTIAGFGSSVSSLADKSAEEIRKEKNTLSKDFFGYFPQLAWYSPYITSEKVPMLYAQLVSANMLRIELLKLISGLTALQGTAEP
jgi:hypothetical protein